MSLRIAHGVDARRFTVEVEGHRAELAYRLERARLVIEHAGVPDAIAGRGVAGALAQAALDDARAQGLRVVPACSYSLDYLRRHPQYADLVDS
jgi:predicted GNAT family acetyltransferase